MPYYWKRGMVAGLVVGFMLHVLLQQLALRHPPPATGNYPVSAGASSDASNRGTPLGPLMGLVIFALCCVMPGPKGMGSG